MSSSANNIVISPMNVYWRIEAEHTVEPVADVADSLDGKYFTLFSDYYLWLNSSVGVAADPAPAGKTAIVVAFDPNDTKNAIAVLIQAAIDGVSGLSATISGDVVTAKVDAVGEQDDTVDVDSGFSFGICRKGKNVDLGLFEGELSEAVAPSTFPIKAHQTGVTTLGEIGLGIEENSREIVLLETTKSKLAEFYKIWGGQFTPAAGTEVFGMGTAIVGKSMLVEAARLELVPVNDLGGELSYNYTVMLSLPTPSTLLFSGESPRVLTVTFKGYPDLSKDSRVNTVLIGDPTQTGI